MQQTTHDHFYVHTQCSLSSIPVGTPTGSPYTPTMWGLLPTVQAELPTVVQTNSTESSQ